MAGHLITALKETLVGLNGTLGQIHHVGLQAEVVAGLVEGDVAVMAHAQQLEVNAAQLRNEFIIGRTLGIGVLGQAVEHVGVLRMDVNMVEEIVLHEIAVALLMVGGQPEVLVQVDGAGLREGQVALLIPLHKLLIEPYGGTAGGQTQHAVGLVDHLRRDNVGRPAAHGLVVFGLINAHCNHLLSLQSGTGAAYARPWGVPMDQQNLATAAAIIAWASSTTAASLSIRAGMGLRTEPQGTPSLAKIAFCTAYRLPWAEHIL